MKVKAKNETIAKAIRHPNGMRFGADGTAHWPDDQFTKRRIRDGDVTVVERGAAAGRQHEGQHQHQQQPHQAQHQRDHHRRAERSE